MKSLGHLNKYLLKYKWLLLAGVGFTFLSNFFGVKMPLLLKEVIDKLNTASPDPIEMFGFSFQFDLKNPLQVALMVGALYIGLNILKGLFLFFMRQTIIKVSRFIEYDLKNEIYDHYQKMDYTFYKKNSTGDLMNRISEDVSQVRMYLGPSIMYSLNLVILAILVIYEMVNINGYLTLIVLLPLPIMSVLIYRVSSRMNRASKHVQETQSRLSTIVQETFAGIRVIKAYSREKDVNQSFDQAANEYKNKSMRLVLINAMFMPVIMLLIGLSTILTIYIGGLLTFDGTVELGTIIAFIYFVNLLTWPFASIGWVTSLVQRAAASQTRINEFLHVEPEIKNEGTIDPDFSKVIRFENVSYTYPNSGIQAISNLSLDIVPGETLAIVGRTASGKSTLLKLLLRQIEPESGQVKFGDNNLPTIRLNRYRDEIGIVPQDVFLFSDSIANNLRFGAKGNQATQADLEKFCKMAHVHHNIMDFPEGYETMLGERGVNLSGGQKQRVSIARALIRNPKLLVLDDCLSAVDTETEERILSNLKGEIERKTTVIVSHRISSLRNADRIVVLDQGKKIEEGTHEQLMEAKGAYFEMYQQQLAEDQEAIQGNASTE